jgi:hypothetical protein
MSYHTVFFIDEQNCNIAFMHYETCVLMFCSEVTFIHEDIARGSRAAASDLVSCSSDL